MALSSYLYENFIHVYTYEFFLFISSLAFCTILPVVVKRLVGIVWVYKFYVAIVLIQEQKIFRANKRSLLLESTSFVFLNTLARFSVPHLLFHS